VPVVSCQVTSDHGEPKAKCLPAGTFEVKEPCFSTHDCAPGLACVVEGAAAVCLRYCCDGDMPVGTMNTMDCEPGSYCAFRSLSVEDENDSIEVPVCAPAKDCGLNEPFPCPEGSTCSCEPGTACMVVRSDGTTTCATPGLGELGDDCPCAWGYVCSQASQTCVQLCETERAEYYCGNEKCQASAELPEAWGVCVEPTDAAAR
jgi:hypothetical protein